MLLAMHAIFTGNVQGVGFRATVRHLALREGLTGTVRNLSDGTVELFVQGDKLKVENLLKEIQKQFHIVSVEVNTPINLASYEGFSIL
jgi:acylphosphatase